MDDARVVSATGKAPAEWFTILDGRGARDLPHREIAMLLHEAFGVTGWWSQMLTVEYEKHIGRRETGQRQDGRYEASVTRTLPGDMDAVLQRWLARLPAGAPDDGFDGVAFAGPPRLGGTQKRRAWRVALADATRVEATVSAKPGTPASLLAVTHSKLGTRTELARWKAFWKAYLAEV